MWVWDMQDMSRDFAQYDPGNDYWDVFAFDVYGDGYEDVVRLHPDHRGR